MSEDDLIVTVGDIRAQGHCPIGIRRWFEDHGFDFRDVLKNGVPASKLLATNCGLAQNVVRKVKEKRNGR